SILERLGRFDGSSNLPYPISVSQSCPFYGSRHHLFCMDRKNARRILAILAGRYPDRWARERYAASPFEVLITTILSAQTTDKSVDAIRDELFSRFPGPQSLATADIAEVEEIIHSTGFFHMKAKHIIAASRTLV